MSGCNPTHSTSCLVISSVLRNDRETNTHALVVSENLSQALVWRRLLLRRAVVNWIHSTNKHAPRRLESCWQYPIWINVTHESLIQQLLCDAPNVTSALQTIDGWGVSGRRSSAMLVVAPWVKLEYQFSLYSNRCSYLGFDALFTLYNTEYLPWLMFKSRTSSPLVWSVLQSISGAWAGSPTPTAKQ